MPEQKFLEWMICLVSKFCKAVELVLDTCASTFSTVKTCFHIIEHHRFDGCVKDSLYYLDAFPSVLELYAKQVSSVESEITESDEVVDASKLFEQKMAATP